MTISDDFTQAEFAAKHISSKSPIKPPVAIVLGSGLGGFADEMTEAVRISYNDIPHFARSTAIGHAGQLVMGNIGECPVVVMQGRVHLYEGYPVRSVVFPMRVFSRMGVRAAILTNAAGGINPEYGQGRLVAISDHINMQGQNPLVGPEDPNLGLRFIDMSEAYSRDYRKMAIDAGKRLGIPLGEGIYAAMLGPSYETPAEIRYLRVIGADVVGMSTVPEVIVGVHAGLRNLGLSVITDQCLPDALEPAVLEDIIATANVAEKKLRVLVRRVIEELP